MKGSKSRSILVLCLCGGLAACGPESPTAVDRKEGRPALARISGAEHGGRPLFATMTGPQEVPPGDPDGTGTARFTLNQGRGEICYEISVSNIALPATASHIHLGAAGVGAGPPVVFLDPPVDGTATGCVAVDPATIQAIRQNPPGYYVNVHNAVYPSGAVRGQLQK